MFESGLKMGEPDSTSVDFGFDISEMVAQRLAAQNKKTVHLSDLMKDTKFTKEEIKNMYRGFKQVRRKTFRSSSPLPLFESSFRCALFRSTIKSHSAPGGK